MTGPGHPAPPGRVRPQVVVAAVVAAVMAVGIAGLVVVALWGGHDDPTGRGLEPPVDAAQPAVAAEPDGSAAPPEAGGAAVPAPPAGAPGDGPEASGPEASGPSAGDGGVTPQEPAPAGDGTAAALTPLISIEPLASDVDLPAPGSDPVALPALLPPPGSAVEGSGAPPAAFDPDAAEGLDGWSVVARGPGYLRLGRGAELVEVFVRGPATDATAVLQSFLADLDDGLSTVSASPPTLLAASESRWMSVVGAEYTATRATQQGTTTISGSVVAAVDTEGAAVVLTTSRAGAASAAQRAADGALLADVLAAVAAE